jgi:hypothetical protein
MVSIVGFGSPSENVPMLTKTCMSNVTGTASSKTYHSSKHPQKGTSPASEIRGLMANLPSRFQPALSWTSLGRNGPLSKAVTTTRFPKRTSGQCLVNLMSGRSTARASIERSSHRNCPCFPSVTVGVIKRHPTAELTGPPPANTRP